LIINPLLADIGFWLNDTPTVENSSKPQKTEPPKADEGNFKATLEKLTDQKESEEPAPVEQPLKEDAEDSLSLDLVMQALAQTPLTTTTGLKDIKPDLPVQATPDIRQTAIQDMQIQLKQAMLTHGALNIRVNPETSVILRFNHHRVSAEYNTQALQTGLYLQHKLEQFRQDIQADKLPVDTVNLKYRQPANKQKKRQS
jgi:hypothetical protein